MKRIWIAAAVAAVVLVVGFILLAPHAQEVSTKALPHAATEAAVPPVFVHDNYKKGVHKLGVSVAAPNACTSVSVSAAATVAASSTPAAILISITMPGDSGVCLQGVATTTTTLSVSAPQGATISASVNGADATVISN